MVSNRKKRQTNKRLLSQLDDFDRDIIIGNTDSERQENAVVNESTNDRDFTVGTSNNSSVVNGNAMSVESLETCFNERIDRELSNIVDTVEDRIRNAILAAIDNIIAPKIELAIRSTNASSGRDVTSVSANSERRGHVGIIVFFENASGNNHTLGVSNVNDETRHNIPDEVSELSVPETHFDRQPHTHHCGIPGIDICFSTVVGYRNQNKENAFDHIISDIFCLGAEVFSNDIFFARGKIALEKGRENVMKWKTYPKQLLFEFPQQIMRLEALCCPRLFRLRRTVQNES